MKSVKKGRICAMSRIKLALEVVQTLRVLAENIEALVTAMESYEDKCHTEKIEDQKSEPIEIEKVRAVLAEKSQSGKQPEVKALILKYGANKLTDINPDYYPELLKEAESL